MNEVLIQNLILAVAMALVGFIAYLLRQLAGIGISYLQLKLGKDRLDLLKSITVTVVRDIEQSLVTAGYDGSQKKQLAIATITKWAEAHGLPIDDELIDRAIEEAVQIMNLEFGKGVPLLPAQISE